MRNEFLRGVSILLNKHLCYPLNLIDIYLTRRCNLRCLQCLRWSMSCQNELTTDEWKKIILDIKNFIGPYFLRFYGGEPFCRDDFLELLNFCSKNNIYNLITTNATLITEPTAKELLKNKIVLIHISIDGFKPETHDRLRGLVGTHQRAMKALSLLQGKVPIQINTTIMQDNLDEILPLTEFAKKYKIPISFQGLVNMHNSRKVFEPDGTLFPKDLQLLDYIIEELCKMKKYNKYITNSYMDLMRLKQYHHNLNKINKKSCEIIYNNQLWIGYNGEVYPCRYIGSIGNLTKNSIKEIWHSDEKNKKIEEMKRCDINGCLVIRGCYKKNYTYLIAKIKQCLFNLR